MKTFPTAYVQALDKVGWAIIASPVPIPGTVFNKLIVPRLARSGVEPPTSDAIADLPHELLNGTSYTRARV
jgi:hypothetical protein